VVRATDTVARLGGDEFAVLIEEVEHEGRAAERAEEILAAALAPYELPTRELRLGASVGVALSASDVAEAEILRHADLALYHAKESGKRRGAVFVPGMQSEMLRRHVLEAELRRGIAQSDLHLLYQPVVSLRSGRAVGAEALVRWRHPERGLIEPSDFIDLA
jgi:predicted signal transduction protein with EAL and GGDEF domain